MTPANAPPREQEVFYDRSSTDALQAFQSPRPPRSFTMESVMSSIWALAALWLGLALLASLLSIWFRISTALSEIVVGTIAQLIIGAIVGHAVLGTDESWVKFLSGLGAIVLTFLAGAELDPAVFRLKWREAAAVGLASFFCPFLGCAAAAHYVLG
jgi:Kef-type K+ transport system membrane component KefB